jgi:serine/threonine protein kinase
MTKRDAQTPGRLAAMRFGNEADVQRFFIPRLLELLGYDVPEDAPAEPPLEFLIAAAGRARIPLKRPDFLVRANGRFLLAIETKAPAEKFSADDIEQALSYARHEDVRAPLTMLANGRRILVLESDTRHPKLDIAHAKLATHYRDLYFLLSKETLGSAIDDGHLHLVQEVGRGAFGIVYEANNTRVKRREAVKVYDFAAGDREPKRRRFRQGAIAHARLVHPNVATFYGTLEYGTELAVRMQFVEGEALDKWLVNAKPAVRERVLLLAEAAETIAFAHENGVVHRDLKPSNIMVVADTRRVRPTIVDFDTAVVVGEATITRSAEWLGSFGYIDPEMLDVRAGRELRDPRSDVYSLGRVLEFLLTGEHPRPGRSMRDLETRVRKATRGLTAREQNLLLEVLLPATAERRDDRTQTAAAFASDLHAIFDERTRGDLNARQYAEAVFAELDALVAAQQLPFEWQNLTSAIRTDEFGRYSPLPRFGELDVLYDEGFYSFYIGPVIADEAQFARFRTSRELRALRKIFGKELRLDPITKDEDGAANLIRRYFDLRRQTPRETALQFAEAIQRFLSVLDPPRFGAMPASLPRDVIGEMESWPSRSFGARSAFKKLANELRRADGAGFAAALLPFLHLLWPEARLTPELGAAGIDIAAGTTVAVQCSAADPDAARRAVEAFRQSPHAVRDFIVIIQREYETVAYREALQLSLDRLIAESKAQRALVWNQRDDVVYSAFELMLERIRRAIERWNATMVDEQTRIEGKLGAAPVRNVPFQRYELRIDATSAWPRPVSVIDSVSDVTESLLHHDHRLLHVLLGTAGFGKTTRSCAPRASARCSGSSFRPRAFQPMPRTRSRSSRPPSISTSFSPTPATLTNGTSGNGSSGRCSST